jgi:hypothetical protein
MTGVLGIWLVGAVFSDGWAHLSVPGLESFFTPWHGALYAGLIAIAAWVGWLGWRGRGASSSLIAGLPAGYRAAALGVVVFVVGGLADMVWHEMIGVEAGIDALVSPSHLVLLSGGVLILTAGSRAQQVASPGRGTFPELLSLGLTAALAAFFLSYTSAFTRDWPTMRLLDIAEGAPGHEAAELPAAAGLASYVVTTAVIVVPLLLMLRAGRRSRGAVTLLVGVTAWLSVAMVGVAGTGVAGALGATVGAAAADGVLSWIRPERARNKSTIPGVAALTALLVWSGQLVGVAVADALRWPVELWLGVVLLAALVAATLGLLAVPFPVRPPRRSRRGEP